MSRQWTKIRLRNFGRSTRGNAATEFALCLPLLILIMVAVIEMGRGLRDFHVVNETVRDAARYLSRVPIPDDHVFCSGPGIGVGALPPGPPFSEAQHIDRAKALAMTGKVGTAPPAPDLLGYWKHATDKGTITVSFDCIDNSANDFQGIYANAKYGGFVPHVVLTAVVPFTFMFGELVTPGSINFTLVHNVVMTGR